MNIAFYIFFPGGGIGRYTYELLKSMYFQEHYKPALICSPDYEWRNSDNINAKPVLRGISHSIPFVRKGKFLFGQFINPHLAINWVNSHDIEILHFADFNHLSFPFWYPALKNSQIKITVSAHDITRQESIINRTWEDRQLRNFYQAVDGLFVHSEYQKRELITFANVNPAKVFIVPHGMYAYPNTDKSKEELRRKWDISESAKVALFFGQIRDEKNLDSFIKAVSQCNEELNVIVAGRGGGRHTNPEYYKMLAKKYNISNRIKFIVRYISDSEVTELFTISDWIALPYKKSFTSQSGVLNVAAYYKKPLLVGPAPVLQETVLKYDIGIVCEDGSEFALKEGILKMNERINNGYQFDYSQYHAHFKWGENARRTIDVFKSLIR